MATPHRSTPSCSRPDTAPSAPAMRAHPAAAPRPPGDSLGPQFAIVCSRLGRDLSRRRKAFWFLQRAVLEARAIGARLRIVPGTAAEPWVRRAAQLFQVPLTVAEPSGAETIDQAMVGPADRVFAIWTRRGGTIARLLQRRAAEAAAATTWLAVHEHDRECAAAGLRSPAIVQWYASSTCHPTEQLEEPAASSAAGGARVDRGGPPDRLIEPGRLIDLPASIQWSDYLVHCTRGRSGPLPGQSESQYADEILLGGAGALPADPLQTLRRILTVGWLCGSARVTQAAYPIVCWSAVPLPELLRRRTFRAHLGRWDYEPFGIAIRRRAAERLGILPAIYGAAGDKNALPDDQRWRYQAAGRTGGWQAEREWRHRGSLALQRLGPDEAFVFVAGADAARSLAADSGWPVVDVAALVQPADR